MTIDIGKLNTSLDQFGKMLVDAVQFGIDTGKMHPSLPISPAIAEAMEDDAAVIVADQIICAALTKVEDITARCVTRAAGKTDDIACTALIMDETTFARLREDNGPGGILASVDAQRTERKVSDLVAEFCHQAGLNPAYDHGTSGDESNDFRRFSITINWVVPVNRPQPQQTED